MDEELGRLEGSVPRPPTVDCDMEVMLAEVESPKSVIHGTSSGPMSTLSGFRSRWMILCACTASMPRAMPASSRTMAKGVWNWWLSSASCSVPLGA